MKKFFEYDVAIIGGGAAALFAASILGKNNIKTAIIEANNKLGAKILQTGNGKCNYTNLHIKQDCYQNSDNKRAFEIIEKFNNLETIEYFKTLGIYPKIRDGYVYPRSETALSVANAFRLDLEANKVKQFLNCKANKIEKNGQDIRIFCVESFEDREISIEIVSKYLIIATGSAASLDPKKAGKEENVLKSLGLKFIKFKPALVALKTDNNNIKLAKGVRAYGCVKVLVDSKEVASDIGEIQYADYGISGIPVFQVSRYAVDALNRGKEVLASLDLTPDFSYEELVNVLESTIKNCKKKTLREVFDGIINHKLMEFVLKYIGANLDMKAENCTDYDIKQIADALKNIVLNITDSKGISAAQVCQGGISFTELDDNLELIRYKNIYACGEIVDVDAKCGGYNLQWAWSSAHLVARSIIGDYSGKTNN